MRWIWVVTYGIKAIVQLKLMKVANEDVGFREGVIVASHIPWVWG
jgi:hypothetical protein